MITYTKRCLLLCPLLYAAIVAHGADGNELAAIGAIQKGTAGAGIASPKDALWALTNPASMVDLDSRVDFSFETLLIEAHADVRGFPLVSNPAAQNLSDYSAIPIPTIAAVWRPSEQEAFGLGIIGIQGNRLEWRKSRATVAMFEHEDRRSSAEVAKIPISYAYQFDNGWTVGGSLLGIYTRFRTDSLTLRLRPTQGDYEWDIGFGVGLQLAVYRNWDTFAFGATYTTRQPVQQYDKYEDVVKWNLDLPEKFQAGIAWRPRNQLELTLDYKWQHWSELKQFSERTINGGLGWIDQHIVKTGVTWDPDGPWTFRAGVSHGNAPVREKFIFANVLTPAIAETHWGAGFSYAFNERSSFHFGYLRSLENEMQENGRGDIFSILGKGSTATYAEESITIQYSYKF